MSPLLIYHLATPLLFYCISVADNIEEIESPTPS